MLVQRLGMDGQKDGKYLNSLVGEIKAHHGCCDEVWLTTDYGYPPLEKHIRSARELLNTAEFLRKNGIMVSLQLANTLGHGEYMSSRDCSGLVYEGSPVGEMTDISGRKNRYCFCYNDGFFREYVKKSLLAYKDLEPKKLWLDDDLRFFHHGSTDIGCFCDNCIEKFNRKNGTAYTRAELAVLFMKDEKVRKLYASFMGDSLADFVREITEPFHKACPETVFGLQYGDMKTALTADFKKVLLALKEVSGHNSETRPGGGVYEDYNPNLIVRGTLHANFLNSQLPESVKETMPEIENLPDVVYGKSPAGTCLTATLNFAGASSTDMTFAMVMRTYEPMSYHGKVLGELARHRPYWEKLVEINRTTVQSGLNFVFARDTMRETDSHPFNAVNDFHIGVYDGVTEFLRTGIPLAFDGKKKDGAYLITKENAPFLSEEQMRELLARPVICDAEAFIKINGIYHAFDCEFGRVDGVTAAKLACRFTDSEKNGEYKNRTYPKSFYNATLYRCTDYKNNPCVEPLSYYYSDAKDITAVCDGEYPYGISDAVVTSVNGVKWVVCGTDLLNPTISTDRRNQLLGAIESICPDAVKTAVYGDCQAMIMPREDSDGRIMSVSILNMTIGESGEMTLRIKKPAGGRFVFEGQYVGETELEAAVSGNEYAITVPRMPAWSVGTVFVK